MKYCIFIILTFLTSQSLAGDCSIWIYTDMAKLAATQYSLCESEDSINVYGNPEYEYRDCAKNTQILLNNYKHLCNKVDLAITQVQNDLATCHLYRVMQRANSLRTSKGKYNEILKSVDSDILKTGADSKICGDYIIKKGNERSSLYFNKGHQKIP